MVATPITTTGATEATKATVALATIMAEVVPIITEVAPIMEATLITMVEVAPITTAEVLAVETSGLGRMKMETGRVVRLRAVRHRTEMITARALRCGATHSV
jgi:hypothetical protein